MPHIVLASLALWIGFRSWPAEKTSVPVSRLA
jgi:hypothetical protein